MTLNNILDGMAFGTVTAHGLYCSIDSERERDNEFWRQMHVHIVQLDHFLERTMYSVDRMVFSIARSASVKSLRPSPRLLFRQIYH